MKIDIDKKSGFCFGVVKAIETAEQYLQNNETLYCLGDIVHNDEEIARLEKLGLVVINHEQFKKLNNCTVLLRAHGEPPETYQIAQKNNIELIDATCPVVLKLQKRVKKSHHYLDNKNGQVVIFGKHKHAEVIGLNGQTNNKAIVIENKNELDKIDLSRPIHLYSQTTKNLKEFNEISQIISEKTTHSEYKSHDTICRQVSNRTEELQNFSKSHDVIVFVSGKKSSNGKYLFSVCKEANANSYFVSSENELSPQWFEESMTIGICGATSTPNWLMDKIAERIRSLSKN